MAISQPRPCAPLPLACLALLLGAPALAAAAPPVELRWDAPASCPAEVFNNSLSRHLGARAAADAPLAVHASLREPTRGRWQLDLDIAATGPRRLTAERCETVADAAAFIVAQAIVDAATSATPPREPPPDASPVDPARIPAPPAPSPTITTPNDTTPHATATAANDPSRAPSDTTSNDTPLPPKSPAPNNRPAPLRVALQVNGGFTGGALPTLGGELGLLLGLLGPRWRTDLLARGILPTRTTSSAAPEVSARLGLWTLGARACAVPRRGAFEFPLCGGAELGQVLARSEGLADDGRAALVWAAVTASPGLAWTPRPSFAVIVSARLAVALVRHDILVLGLPRLHRLGPVDAGLSLALEWRLPELRRSRA